MSLPGHYCHNYCPSIPEWRATVPGQRGFCLLFVALPCLAPLVIAGGGCNCVCICVCREGGGGEGEGEGKREGGGGEGEGEGKRERGRGRNSYITQYAWWSGYNKFPVGNKIVDINNISTNHHDL